MDEINYQLSLILLDLLKFNGLLTNLEADNANLELQEHYQPIVTGLTLLNRPSE